MTGIAVDPNELRNDLLVARIATDDEEDCRGGDVVGLFSDRYLRLELRRYGS